MTHLRFVPTLALALAALSARAQSGSVYVNAQSNIFGYGVGTPQPGGGGGGILATSIALASGTSSFTFSATGQAGWQSSINNGPDGGTFANNTNIPAVGPISGFTAPLSGELVGLFIPAGNISALTAPAALSYPNLGSFAQASYAPGLRQVFFIGDGLTGTGAGATQTFVVPAGTATLVLGIADAFAFVGPAGSYDDNLGGYTVNYAAPVPEPSALVAVGLGALSLLRRRRK